MKHQAIYIEPLIQLIELNSDPAWLNTFYDLRKGFGLPGGGAGSLNDWGPSYRHPVEQNWYTHLYQMLRYLYDRDLPPEALDKFKTIEFRSNVRVLRCVGCQQRYQHPALFETPLALGFYANQIPFFQQSGILVEITRPEKTFFAPMTEAWRTWLVEQYKQNQIVSFDFVAAGHRCPNCKQQAQTEHDLFFVRFPADLPAQFQLVKSNASWNDFEQHYAGGGD